MNVIYKSRTNGEFAVVYYVYAHWLLNQGNSSKGGFHGTHRTPSRSATEQWPSFTKQLQPMFITPDQVNDIDRSNNRKRSIVPLEVNLTPPPNLVVDMVVLPTSTFSGKD